MDNILVRGKSVTLTLYRGESRVVAEKLYLELTDKRATKTPVPLNGTDLSILIDDVIKMESADFSNFIGTVYKIDVKGELI